MWNKAATLMKLLLLVGCLSIYSVSANWEESTIEDIFLHDAGLTLTSEELEGEIHRIDNNHPLPSRHAVVRVTKRARRRRDLNDSGMKLSMNFLDQSHTFQMVPNNGLLSPHYIVEEVGDDGNLHEVPSIAQDCYFVQEIGSESLSAVTVCNSSVEGLVTADNHTFIIQPRVNNEEELIIYEVDKEHLPHNYIEGMKGIHCPPPHDPVDGSVTWESRGIIRYSCDPGFSLVGASVQMCLSSGEWNDSMPMCASDSSDDVSRMSCPSLLYPDHGVLRVKEGEATYGCKDDYALSGNKKRYCQRNGEWTGRDPSCVEDFPLERDLRKKRAFFNHASFDSKEVIELLFFCDKPLFTKLGSKRAEVEKHAMSVLNLFASIMQDPSLGHPIYIKLARLVIETRRTVLSTSRDADVLLNNFCSWQDRKNLPITNIKHHDYALLLTGRDICITDGDTCYSSTIGYANIGGVCNGHRACGLVDYFGVQSGFTCAHETGHGLSMNHDARNNQCINEGFVMASTLGPGSAQNMYKWSECSKRELQQYRASGQTSCLQEDHALNELIAPGFPGFRLNLENQCKAIYGPTSSASRCRNNNVCERFYCTNPERSNQCWTKYNPAADGTRCGTRKICYKGECINNVTTAVNGEWGRWSAWSGCSHTCDCGVQCRSRECNNPKPKFGGRFCSGPSKECRTCNCQTCQRKVDERAQLCTNWNRPFWGEIYKWSKYPHDDEEGCLLLCQPKGEDWYAWLTELDDGVACKIPSSQAGKGKCIQGICVPLDCQNKIKGTAAIDKCGVCKGDNSTCNYTHKTIQKSFQVTGYKTLKTIPKGARSLLLKETPNQRRSNIVLSYGGARYTSHGRHRVGGMDFFHTYYSSREDWSCNGTLKSAVKFEVYGERGVTTRVEVEYITDNQVTNPPATTSTTSPPTTRRTTRPPTTATTRPPTTRRTTRPPTTATTSPPTTRRTTRPPTTATTRPPTTRRTTRPPTTATTRPPTTRRTTRPPTTATTSPPTTPATTIISTQPTLPTDCPENCVNVLRNWVCKVIKNEGKCTEVVPVDYSFQCKCTCSCPEHCCKKKKG